MPNDVIFSIMYFLSARDLTKCSRCSTEFYNIANEVGIALFTELFGRGQPFKSSRSVIYQVVERARAPSERNLKG